MNSLKHFVKACVSILFLVLGVSVVNAAPTNFTVSASTASHWRSFGAIASVNPGASITIDASQAQFNSPALPNPGGVAMLGGTGFYGVALLSPSGRVAFNGWLYVKNSWESVPPGYLSSAAVAGFVDGYLPSFGPLLATNGESGTWYAFIFRGNPLGITTGGSTESEFDIPVGVWKMDYAGLTSSLSIVPQGGYEWSFTPADLLGKPETYLFYGGADYNVDWTTTGATSVAAARDGATFSTNANGSRRFDEPPPPEKGVTINYTLQASAGGVSKDRTIQVQVVPRDLQLTSIPSTPAALLSPADQTVTLGGSVTLTPSVPDASQVSSTLLSGDGVNVANPGGLTSLTPTSYGDKVYTFTATGRARLTWLGDLNSAASLVLNQPDGSSLNVSGFFFTNVTQSGSYTLTVTDTSGKSFTSDPLDVVVPTATATAIVHVRLPRTIDFPNTSTVYRDTITLAASTNGDGAPTYSLVSGPATVSGAQLQANAVGTAVVRVSYPETASYEAKSVTANVTINPRPVNLTVNPASYEYDGATKTLTYSVDDPVAITEGGINASGLTGGPNAGSYTLTVSAFGNYSGSASGVLTITPAVVTATWPKRTVDGPYQILTSDVPTFKVKKSGAVIVGTTSLSWKRKDDKASGTTFVGDSILPGNYTLTAHFSPPNGNYQSANVNAAWGVTLPVTLSSSNSSYTYGGQKYTSEQLIRVLPGTSVSVTAEANEDYAWGDSWDDPAPRIWNGPDSLVGAGTSPTCIFTAPAGVASVGISAAAYQLPPRVTEFTPIHATYTVPAGVAAGKVYNRSWKDESGKWKAYLGRDGVTLSVTGQVRESGVAAFEIQAKSPTTDWTTIASGKPSGSTPNGALVQVPQTFSMMLGTVHGDKPLIPSDKSQVGVWEFRARVQRSNGNWSSYSLMSLDAVWPLVTVTKDVQTLPPAGPEAKWFEASEIKTATFQVWVP